MSRKLRVAKLIDKIALAYGEPFADTSALPSYLVAKLARQHVTVALSGDGGDEIFAGYRRYPFFLAEERMRSLAPGFVRQPIFGLAAFLYPKLDWAPRPLRFKTTFDALAQTQASGYARAAAINLPGRIQKIMSRDFKQSLDGYAPESVIPKVMDDANTDDLLSRAQYADLMTWLPGRMLTKMDRASMAHALEVRPPLLDHKLVEWAGMLPSTFKLKDGERKRVLKAALAPRLGEAHLNRPKRGFDLPVANWLKGEDNSLMQRLNNASEWRESGFF